MFMDRDTPLGNSEGVDARRALHVKIKNTALEPIPFTATIDPTGLASEATQAAINAKLPALGQHNMAGSVSVVIASDQIPLSVSATIDPTGLATEATQAEIEDHLDSIDGHLDANLSTRATESTLNDIKTTLNEMDVDLDGLATEATLGGVKTGTDHLDVNLSTRATETTLSAVNAKLGSLGQKAMAGSAPVVIASDQSAVPVSVASLPLPSGASTSANQATEIASLASIDTKTPALVSGRQPVDGSGVTQPVSAVSLPLPAGAATETTLAGVKTGTDKIPTFQTSGSHSFSGVSENFDLTLNGNWNTLKFQIFNIATGSFFFTASMDGTNFSPIYGADLNILDGQQIASADPGVNDVGPNDILEFNVAGLKVFRIQGSTPQSISWYLSLATPTAVYQIGESFTQAYLRGDSGDFLTDTPVGPSIKALDVNVAQTVAPTSLPLPAGAATETTLASINTKTPAIGPAAKAASTPVTMATDQPDINTKVNVALPTGTNSIGQVTSNAGTNTSTANLDVALSTRLKPADTLAGITTVAAVTAITNALPAGTNLLGKVGIDQTTPGTTNGVQVNNFPATQPVSATALPLPSGAATSALQTTGNASLASIDTKLTNPLPVSVSSLPLPAGGSTAANQATEIASLASVDTKLTSQATAANQATSNASVASVDTKMSTLLTQTDGIEASLSSIDTNLAKLPIGQGSNLGSNFQVLNGAVVKQSVPTYIDGQISPLSQTIDGRLLVNSEDLTSRRLAEANYLEQLKTSYAALLFQDASNSEKRGFEIR